MSEQETHEREAKFHDRWAQSTELDSIAVDEAFEAPTALENQYILKTLGCLKGKRVLDIGCGLGESSVKFAKMGAITTASDLSPEMVRLTYSNAQKLGLTVNTCAGPAETLDLPDGSFDVIYAANIIHHITDRARFFANVNRLLDKGGVFCAWDPVKYNPVINIYRRMATDVRTDDEMPLGREDLKKLRQFFPEVHVRFFWLLSLTLFMKYFVFDRVHPNKERYWKRIYRETNQTLWWWLPLRWLDSLLLRLPLMKWLSWNVVMICRKS